MKFPALVISTDNIDLIRYRYFVADIRYINVGYKDVMIVDLNGDLYLVDGVKKSGGVSVWDSIKNMGWLVKIEPILKKPVKKIKLDELKEIVSNIIKRYPKKFSNLSDKSSLLGFIDKSKTIKELIEVFHG